MVHSSGEDIEEGAEDDDDEFIQAMEEEQRRFDAQLPMLILPLYSMLPTEQQAKVTHLHHYHPGSINLYGPRLSSVMN